MWVTKGELFWNTWIIKVEIQDKYKNDCITNLKLLKHAPQNNTIPDTDEIFPTTYTIVGVGV